MDSYKRALIEKIKEISDLITNGMGDSDVLMESEHGLSGMEEKEEEVERQEEDKAPIVKDTKMDDEEVISKHPGRMAMSFKEKAKAYKG